MIKSVDSGLVRPIRAILKEYQAPNRPTGEPPCFCSASQNADSNLPELESEHSVMQLWSIVGRIEETLSSI